MRPALNPADRNNSLAGSSSKRKQGMSGLPETAEEGLPLMILPGVIVRRLLSQIHAKR